MISGQRHAETAIGSKYDLRTPELVALVRRAVRRVVNEADAEDVTQEALLELWRQEDRFDSSRGNVQRWAQVIARRRAIDFVRSQVARTAREGRHARLLDEPPSSFEMTCAERIHLVGALSELAAPQRRAIVLMYFGGLTAAEIALRDELPIGTVKSRIRDGLTRLRGCPELRPRPPARSAALSPCTSGTSSGLLAS